MGRKLSITISRTMKKGSLYFYTSSRRIVCHIGMRSKGSVLGLIFVCLLCLASIPTFLTSLKLGFRACTGNAILVTKCILNDDFKIYYPTIGGIVRRIQTALSYRTTSFVN